MKDNKIVCKNCGQEINIKVHDDKCACCTCDKEESREFKFNVLQTLSIIIVSLSCLFAYYKLNDIVWLVILQIYATCIIIRGYMK